ncbi:MAG: thiamine phosphate synthase [Akkermansiaceae bacterium]
MSPPDSKKDNAQRLALKNALLYGILDLGYIEKANLESVVSDLVDGGCGVIQLRAKGYSADEVLKLIREEAPEIVGICRSQGVPFIINDYPDVALAVGADGVHIGQDDGSLLDVRNLVGDEMIVGRSTHSSPQAKDALYEGFDYIGFGPLFPTPTKQGRPGIGLDEVKLVQDKIGTNIPMFCIGGIKPDNLELVLASGACRVVIVSALLQADDIKATTQGVLEILKNHN